MDANLYESLKAGPRISPATAIEAVSALIQYPWEMNYDDDLYEMKLLIRSRTISYPMPTKAVGPPSSMSEMEGIKVQCSQQKRYKE